MGLEYAEPLKRTKETKPQAHLLSASRKSNIKDAFSLSPNISVSQYPNIILLDDVWTTGSTLKECAKILKRSGVQKVWALTLAR